MGLRFEEKKNELLELMHQISDGKKVLASLSDQQLKELESQRSQVKHDCDQQLKELESQRSQVKHDCDQQLKKFESKRDELKRDIDVLNKLHEEKTKGFPWVVNAYDSYIELRDGEFAENLETKSHPARKAAEDVRQISKERREAEKAARIANNILQYCRFLAPWVDDYIGIEAQELDAMICDIHSAWEKKETELDEDVKRQIGPSVWDWLTPTEKLQRKLDWYWNKPEKSNWQIGRDYENYIGYLYECKGWDVYFHGRKGFEDLGRDLICKKDKRTEIIQCKYWSQERTIHEKNIYYLFGTTVEYYIENFGKTKDLHLALFPEHIRKKDVTAKLITTTGVSSKAEQVAKTLEVVIERLPFQCYPSVKCNVSRKTGEKIYHLPFDQQYETILIEEERAECYVETVFEAERLGFRHAYKWTGET